MGDGNMDSSRYRLSFSVGGLLVAEAQIAAPLYLELRDWQAVRSKIDAANMLQSRTVTSAQRVGREIVQRLSELTIAELDLLSQGIADERAQLMWIAACRRYELVGQFAESVVRERFLLMNRTLNPRDFDAFLREKALWHEELQHIAESTRKKLRANVFLMLREADLLSDVGEIQASFLSPRVAALVREREPSDVRFFPTVDRSLQEA